jgi:hypothetical protein
MEVSMPLSNMILDAPASFHLLTTDIKERIIEAARNKVNIHAALTRRKALAREGGKYSFNK